MNGYGDKSVIKFSEILDGGKIPEVPVYQMAKV
jgi:hypothetical protein